MPHFTDHLADHRRSSKRALRRHHRQRMIQRAQRTYVVSGMDDEEMLMWARCNHDHMKVCSCWMCGNRRKWAGRPPVQERRQLLAADADGAEA